MISTNEVANKIKDRIEVAEIQVEEIAGKADHFFVHVVSSSFEGKTLIEQHQMINGIFQEELLNGDVHALQIKTATP